VPTQHLNEKQKQIETKNKTQHAKKLKPNMFLGILQRAVVV